MRLDIVFAPTVTAYSGTGGQSACEVSGDEDRDRVTSGRSSSHILSGVTQLTDLTAEDYGGVIHALMKVLDARLITLCCQFQDTY